MRTVFGIDVSKASSEVAILVNGERVHGLILCLMTLSDFLVY